MTRRAGLRRRLAKSGLSPRGKNGTFSEKNAKKKGPKTGSGGITPVGTISQFFHHFRGFPKIRVEKSRAGKGGEAGAYALRKNHKKSGMTDKQTRAV